MKTLQCEFSPQGKPYTYTCSDELFEKIEPGTRVVVPTTRGLAIVTVVSKMEQALDPAIAYKEIHGIHGNGK